MNINAIKMALMTEHSISTRNMSDEQILQLARDNGVIGDEAVDASSDAPQTVPESAPEAPETAPSTGATGTEERETIKARARRERQEREAESGSQSAPEAPSEDDELAREIAEIIAKRGGNCFIGPRVFAVLPEWLRPAEDGTGRASSCGP